jgi:hypothetical protein
MTTVAEMRRISLRRLLSKLTLLAVSATAVMASATPQTDAKVIVDEDLDSDLPIDREHVDPRDAAAMLGRSLASALAELPALDAIHLASTWALSEDPLRRTAIARALEWTFPLLGDALIIDHLSRDPDPVLRAACARAAWVRRTTGGDPGVLDRLSRDADPEVRSIALGARRG